MTSQGDMDDEDFQNESMTPLVFNEFDVWNYPELLDLQNSRSSYVNLVEKFSDDHTTCNKMVSLSSDFKKVENNSHTNIFLIQVFLKEYNLQKYIFSDFVLQSTEYELDYENGYLVRVIEHIHENDKLIIVHEHLNEHNYLTNKLKRSFMKNELKLKSYITDVLEGVKSIHQLGYVHLDLRVSNLLCYKEPFELIRQVKIGGLELVLKQDTALDERRIEYIRQKFSLLPPEFKDDYIANTSFDVWCLGLIFYQMSVGYKPFFIVGDSRKIKFRRQDWVDVDMDLMLMIQQMLSPNQRDRPSIEELLQNECLNP